MSYISDLSHKFGVNAEEKNKDGGYPVFLNSVKNKKVLLLADKNTENYISGLEECLKSEGVDYGIFVFPEYEPVADERAIQTAIAQSKDYGYILAVGAGTLNDIAKYSGFLTGKKSGVLATAPSMDGFTSSVTPLIENSFKITRNAQCASDILIDYDILKGAPKIMTGAGVGDILAKFCSLSDWEMSAKLFNEEYNVESASLMRRALNDCDSSVPQILKGDKEGISALMNALLISGYAMVISGNSRPASGAEHHVSHYLEMDFLKRGKRIPLHGVKVGLGTMLSLRLYKGIIDRGYSFDGEEVVRDIAKRLPEPKHVKDILTSFNCPVKFSELDVPKDTVYNMLFEAYKIRDRFTIMRLYNEYGFMKDISEELMEEYY